MIIDKDPCLCTRKSIKLSVTVCDVTCNMLPVIGQNQGNHSYATWGITADFIFCIIYATKLGYSATHYDCELQH